MSVPGQAEDSRSPAMLVRPIVGSLVLLLLICQHASASIDFIQLTDPHLFGGVRENEQALRACIQKINALNKVKAYRFVVLTGDVGIEDLVTTKNPSIGSRELKANWDEDRKKGAEDFANVIAESEVKKWLFVPGNNDLVDEDPGTIDYYNSFIADLSEFLRARGSGIEAVNLTDKDSNTYIVDGRYAFIGFNDAPFKSNNLAQNADGWKNAQLEEINKVDQSLRKILDSNGAQFAYIFYHIPEVDDPYYVLDVLPKEPKGADRWKYERERDKAGINYWIDKRGVANSPLRYSAWTVKDEVWSAWNKLVARESVKGLFAGHFHDWRQSTYGNFQWLITKNYPKATLNKLHICPPVAVKNQLGKPDEARGFCEVNIADDGNVAPRILWYFASISEGKSDKGRDPQSAGDPVWWIELIKVSPGLIGVALAIGIIVAYRREARALFERMTKLKGLGVEAEFAAKALENAIAAQQVAVSANDKKGVLRRLHTVAPLLRDARILWVDDNPANNRNERALLESLGVRVTSVTTSVEAEKELHENIYLLVITDLKREGKDTEGLDFVNRTVASGTYRWTIAYVGADPWGKPTPAYLFAMTSRPDHLMHYICDVVERERL